MKKRRPFSIILYIAILAMAFSLIFGIFGNGTDNVPYSTVIKLLENGQVKSFVVEGNRIALTLHTTYDGKSELICELADVASFRAEVQHILDAQSTSGRLESYHFYSGEFPVCDEVDASFYDPKPVPHPIAVSTRDILRLFWRRHLSNRLF